MVVLPRYKFVYLLLEADFDNLDEESKAGCIYVYVSQILFSLTFLRFYLAYLIFISQ